MTMQQSKALAPSELESLKASVKTRGLTTGGGPQTPLRELKGDLEDWTVRIDTSFAQERLMVQLNLSNIEVIRSEQPYDFPNADIEIRNSDRKNSAWGFWALSTERFIPEGGSMDLLKGKRIHISYQDTNPHDNSPIMLWNGKTSEAERADVQTPVWVLLTVGGVVGGVAVAATPVDKTDLTIGIIDGKAKVQAQQDLMKNDVIRADSDLVSDIVDGRYIDELVNQGKLTFGADGLYHRVDAPAE